MPSILKAGWEKWHTGEWVPYVFLGRNVKPSKGEEGFIKVCVLALLQGIMIWAPTPPKKKTEKEKENWS